MRWKLRGVESPRRPCMPQKSAGLLLFRETPSGVEVLLVHPGGPFWAKKDAGAWSIPKGEIAGGEEPLNAAQREVEEELGFTPVGNFIPLEPVRQTGGKIVFAWAVRADFNPSDLRSNRFSLEWPPKSGRRQEFPEVDAAAWFGMDAARSKMIAGQVPLLDQLLKSILPHRTLNPPV